MNLKLYYWKFDLEYPYSRLLMKFTYSLQMMLFLIKGNIVQVKNFS
jgi:hypothetical protein